MIPNTSTVSKSAPKTPNRINSYSWCSSLVNEHQFGQTGCHVVSLGTTSNFQKNTWNNSKYNGIKENRKNINNPCFYHSIDLRIPLTSHINRKCFITKWSFAFSLVWSCLFDLQ